MSPRPEQVGKGYPDKLVSCLKAQNECAEILYRAVEGARAKLGGNPTRLVGLVFDGECVHPLVSEERRGSPLATERFIALGGENFSRLFYARVTEEGIRVDWDVKGKATELYPRCPDGSGLRENGASLNLWAEEGLSTEKGILFFPSDMVHRGDSPERLLETSTIVSDHASFVLVLEALKKAGGLK